MGRRSGHSLRMLLLICERCVVRKMQLGRGGMESEWWSEKLRELIRWKRDRYGRLLQNRSKAGSEKGIKQHKGRGDKGWERRLVSKFKTVLEKRK